MTSKYNFELLRIAFIVLFVAFIVRVTWGLLIPVLPLSDSAAYDVLATTLFEHGVYGWTPIQPSAFWPVGTSAIYAALYIVFGHSFIPIVVLNIIFSVGIIGLTIWLGRIFFDDTTAILAGGVLAIWPSEITYVTILASELPFTFLVLLGFAASLSPRLSTLVRAVGSGLAFGAASYFRPIALLLPIVLWLSMLAGWQKQREGLLTKLLAVVVIGLTVAPWSVRNTRVFGHFVLLSTNGGANLWMGNNPDTQGFYMPPPPSTEGLSEYEQDKVLGEEATKYIIQEPIAFALRTLKKAVLLHVGETISVHWNAEGIKHRFGESALLPLKLLTQGYWTGILLLAFVGLVIMIRDRGLLVTLVHPIVLTWIYFTALYAVTVVQDRYHFPSHPFIAMLSAVALLTAVTHVQRGSLGVRA